MERVGFSPRMPMFGRSPKPSSSRATTPGTLRSASLTVKTRDSCSTDWSMTAADPGIVSSRMRSPTTMTTGSSAAGSGAALSPARATQDSTDVTAASSVALRRADCMGGMLHCFELIRSRESEARLYVVVVQLVNANHSY